MTAIDDVAAERQKQIARHGYTSSHDDFHKDHELLNAALAYVYSARGWPGAACQIWPWAEPPIKPKTAREDLVRSAALIIAEIERLDRENNVQVVHKGGQRHERV